MGKTEKIMLGAGCFWGVEHKLKKLKGVTGTQVGYSGGHKKNPSYEEVCQGNTGHVEVALVEFDPEQIKMTEILDQFWQIHDPTTENRQGPDVGEQYRSVIFYYSPQQKELAEESKAKAQQEFSNSIVTHIEPAKEFWQAEEYHQCYLEKKEG